MSDGLSIAALGMAADVQRFNAISQNLANAMTPGYKRALPAGASFANVLLNQGLLAAPVPAFTAVPDMKPATLRFTGNPLDVALESEGYFELQHEGRSIYTRQGNFALDAAGRLVTQGGLQVSGSGGEIRPASAQVVIDRQGNLLENGKPVAQLKLVRFENPALLQPIGNGQFLQGSAVIDSSRTPQVRQAHLEASNVNSAAEMVRLIETLRHFEAGQKAIQMIDAMNERAISRLGEP
jgi:flagellar basal-body rod protein FlgF